MPLSVFDRGVVTLVASGALLLAPPLAATSAGQAASGDISILQSEIAISRDEAELTLEMEDGREVEFAVRDGEVWLDGNRVGSAARGGELDRSWRALLNSAMDVPTADLDQLLIGWQAPGGEAGRRLDEALERVLTGAASSAALPAATAVPAGPGDTMMARLQEQVRALEAQLARTEEQLQRAEELRSRALELRSESRRGVDWFAPFRYIAGGLLGLLQVLAVFAVLGGLGFAAVFFGRKYLEGIADTARRATLRSGLVGLAGSFLALPLYVLGLVALVITIVGIPVAVVWAILFPVAVVLAGLGGYLAVAHATGEALAERRLRGLEWYRYGNSYYYLLTGLGLLLILFAIANVVHMAGPWFEFLKGLLMFVAVVLTWLVATIGFGAVLISRGGTRPAKPPAMGTAETADLFEEETHV